MADYDALGKALEAVKHTLERLVICFFECGIASSSNFVLGFNKGFLGDARSLRLQEMVKLENLTIDLSAILLKSDSRSGRVIPADMFPQSLVELWLSQNCNGGKEWEEEVIRVIGEIIQSRVVCTGGCLRKIGILRDLRTLNSLQTWPEHSVRKLERVGRKAGVKVVWKWDAERAVWRAGAV